MPDSERPSEHVTGVVQGIITKGQDKWVVEVTPEGSQYAKKLWTKSQDQVAAATDLIGQVASFECGVSEYEREGKMVKSLWLNAINPGTPPQTTAPDATGATESAPQSSQGSATTQTAAAQPAPPRDSFGDPTRASIERQVALKAATRFHQDRADSTFDDVLADAEKADQFLARIVPF